jgi:hypothetical protein
MKLFKLFVVILAMYGCQEASEEISVEDVIEEIEEEEKDYLSEVITRTYSVKMVGGEPETDALQQMQSTTFDRQGLELENTFYNLDNSIASVDRFIYDEDGKQIGSDHFDKGITSTSYYVYELDSKGRRIAYQAFDHGTDALLFKGATRYEEFGKLKKDGYLNEKGNFICNFEYTFDDEGKEIGYVYIDNASGERYSSVYKYVDYNEDKEWVKRLIMSADSVKSIETREFIQKEIE